MQIDVGDYPSKQQVVEFAVWMSMHRERVCLAQRVDSGPKLTGKVKRTVRNMLTELFNHSWPRRWPAFAALAKTQRAAYEDAILKQVDALHLQAALSTAGATGDGATEEERERAAQLTAQTAPVTERKHFYRTEVYQVQDALLAETEEVNAAIALGAACAIMQARGVAE